MNSLGIHFKELTTVSFFSDNVGAYQTLKQIGSRIIRNDSLRVQISSLYENKDELYHVITTEHKEICEDLNSTNGLYFNGAKHMILLDAEGLKRIKNTCIA
jgi:hypothetical protein